MSAIRFEDRIRAISTLRHDVAVSLGLSGVTPEKTERERVFALVDLALTGVITTDQQEELIQQGRARGLLPKEDA